MATIDKVKQIIGEQLNIEIEKIADTSEIVKDLGADSLDVVEILMSLEEEYGVSVPDEDMVNIKSVKDISDLIDKIL